MRRQLVPGLVVCLTVIKAKTRPGIEANTRPDNRFQKRSSNRSDKRSCVRSDNRFIHVNYIAKMLADLAFHNHRD